MRQENFEKLSRCYFVSMEPRYRVINLDSISNLVDEYALQARGTIN